MPSKSAIKPSKASPNSKSKSKASKPAVAEASSSSSSESSSESSDSSDSDNPRLIDSEAEEASSSDEENPDEDDAPEPAPKKRDKGKGKAVEAAPRSLGLAPTPGPVPPYKPPRAFKVLPPPDEPVDKTFSAAYLTGKELWYISAPANVPLSKVPEIDPADIEAGQPIIETRSGLEYTMQPELETAVGLMAFNGKDYRPVGKAVKRCFRVVECLPMMADPVGPRKSVVREQPKGLKVRWRAFGSKEVDGEGFWDGRESEEEEEDVEMRDVEVEKKKKKRKTDAMPEDGRERKKKKSRREGEAKEKKSKKGKRKADA